MISEILSLLNTDSSRGIYNKVIKIVIKKMEIGQTARKKVTTERIKDKTSIGSDLIVDFADLKSFFREIFLFNFYGTRKKMLQKIKTLLKNTHYISKI
ncbi:hypothetical protein BpHYR1_043897 [Brachionus plicatilis]|uniref:Uncharacterized protein n=1 Tax=Brachionus plicatilis TaxID=10195 RepID=A0A3M7SSG0_BRAPC|nr:hypothetical protein BpHYR1_043897 [Brachionus plicatilis]